MAYNYWCSNQEHRQQCEVCNSKGDLQLDTKDEFFCPNNGSIQIKLMGETVSLGIGEKMKHRPPAERKKRSSEHFQKEILPTLPKRDRNHFKRTKGYKL